MSALAEIAVAVFSFLIEITIHIARLAVAPLRFLFSPRYRLATREQWQSHPSRCAAELIGGTLALLLFVGAFSWWLYFFTSPEPTPGARNRDAEFERRVLEKFRDFRNSRQ